ncbi:PREDICTED: protein FAM110C [Nanorana parkeri]|uniref:protein FAM110C n=1 Tax=Nanorana parkeri TaxID=125878 RepID=UPI0008543FC1|nr:PREDICTED: protein FAM110C [Nanorana parkeri]
MPTDIMNAVRMQPISQLQHHSPVLPIRLLSRGPEYLRRQIDTGTPRSSLSAVERLAADKAKYVKSHQVASGGTGGSSASESSTSSSSGGSRKSRHQEEARSPDQPIRRGSSKRLLRPDSLLIYRHKNRADGPIEEARTGLVRRLFLGNVKEKPPVSAASPSADDPRSRTGLHRSQSDISSRYSRSFSDFDTFFQYCGLEPEVVEELGRDRFAAAADDVLDGAGQYRIRSASVATSDSGFSRRSGEDSAGGLQEDEPLNGQIPGVGNANTSVIERNARIIKWLYSCKRAKETRGASPDLP